MLAQSTKSFHPSFGVRAIMTLGISPTSTPCTQGVFDPFLQDLIALRVLTARVLLVTRSSEHD